MFNHQRGNRHHLISTSCFYSKLINQTYTKVFFTHAKGSRAATEGPQTQQGRPFEAIPQDLLQEAGLA
jgi:hypothetical protein